MEKIITTLAATLFSLALSAGVFAADEPGAAGRGETGLQPQADRQQQTAAAQERQQQVDSFQGLIGRNVVNPRNDTLGEIRDLVIDTDTDRVEYVVISTGGFFGYGDEHVVPWQALRMQGQGEPVILDATEEQLKNAPGDKDLANREEAVEIFKFYGLSPYWEERNVLERGPERRNR